MEQGTKLGGSLKRSVIATIQSSGAPSASDGDKLDDGYDDWLIIYNNNDKTIKISIYGGTLFDHSLISISDLFNICVTNLRF